MAHRALRPPRTPPVEQPALRPENTPEYENLLMKQLMEHPGTSFRNMLIIPNSSRNMLMELPVITPENIPTDLHENAPMIPPVIPSQNMCLKLSVVTAEGMPEHLHKNMLVNPPEIPSQNMPLKLPGNSFENMLANKHACPSAIASVLLQVSPSEILPVIPVIPAIPAMPAMLAVEFGRWSSGNQRMTSTEKNLRLSTDV